MAERAGYRHGAKPRRLTLRTGTVQLDVPRARLAEADGSEREWQSQLVPRYRRSSREVEQSVLGVYLSGSNTRRIRGALEPLLSGAALSKSAVSRLVLRLEVTLDRKQAGKPIAGNRHDGFEEAGAGNRLTARLPRNSAALNEFAMQP